MSDVMNAITSSAAEPGGRRDRTAAGKDAS